MGLGGAIRKLRRSDHVDSDLERLRKPEPPGLPPAVDFSAIFDAWEYSTENSVENKSKRKRGIFHPSSGLHHNTGLCQRQLMFELMSAPLSPTNIPGRIVKVLHAGSDRHVGLQSTFKRIAKAGYMGIVDVKDEVHCVHPVLPLSGHMDLLVTTAPGFRYALDFKTWSEKNCAKTFEPEWKHRVQLNTYMGMYGVRTGYMWYENKNNQTVLGPPQKFRVNFSNELYEETEAFCTDVLRDLAEQRLPEYEEKTCKDNITFCAYKEICDAEREARAGWLAFDKRDPATKKLHLKVFEQ